MTPRKAMTKSRWDARSAARFRDRRLAFTRLPRGMAPGPPFIGSAAFSLVELMVAVAVLSMIMLFIAGITGTVSNTWSLSEKRLETYQSSRGVLELMTREMTPAVVDTRMQFAVFKGESLERFGATNVMKNSPALLWMAPLGEQGELRCVGYYLYRDDEREFYRLKRIFITPHDPGDPDLPNPYYPKLVSQGDPRDFRLRVSPTNIVWFTREWDEAAFDDEDPLNELAIVSTAADGIIALWIQCFDVLGNPIPWLSESAIHPKDPLIPMIYNSAGYFQVSSTVPFSLSGGETFLYTNQDTTRGNRVPAAVDITIVAIDSRAFARGIDLAPVLDEYETGKLEFIDSDGTLDLKKSVDAFNELLIENEIFDARTFSTRVKLVNGS